MSTENRPVKWVEVRSSEDAEWERCIFLYTKPNLFDYRFVCVNSGHAGAYQDGFGFAETVWKHMREIQEPELVPWEACDYVAGMVLRGKGLPSETKMIIEAHDLTIWYGREPTRINTAHDFKYLADKYNLYNPITKEETPLTKEKKHESGS